MTYDFNSFISSFGILLVEVVDGSDEPVLTLTTEALTGQIAVYHGDRIWRADADPDWSTEEIAQALVDLAHRADIPQTLRRMGIAALWDGFQKL